MRRSAQEEREHHRAELAQAEARHRTEMKGWKTALTKFDPYPTPATSHLWEIRALATRKY